MGVCASASGAHSGSGPCLKLHLSTVVPPFQIGHSARIILCRPGSAGAERDEKRGGGAAPAPPGCGTELYFVFGIAMPVFLSVVRKKNSERISEATSAIGNANQTLRSTPLSDSRYAAGMSTTI